MRRVELKTLSGATAFVDAADGPALRQQIAVREGVPAGLLRLTCGCREYDAAVLPDGCVRVLLRLEGGKGGFGAMLRTSCGALYTFGSGEQGQLGHGDLCEQLLPKKVQALDVLEAAPATPSVAPTSPEVP